MVLPDPGQPYFSPVATSRSMLEIHCVSLGLYAGRDRHEQMAEPGKWIQRFD